MAVGTEEATFNAAVDALTTAWEVYTDHLDANEQISIIFCAPNKGTNASDSHQGGDLTAIPYDRARVFYLLNRPDTTDNSCWLEAGGKPLFWKLTNKAGEI